MMRGGRDQALRRASRRRSWWLWSRLKKSVRITSQGCGGAGGIEVLVDVGMPLGGHRPELGIHPQAGLVPVPFLRSMWKSRRNQFSRPAGQSTGKSKTTTYLPL